MSKLEEILKEIDKASDNGIVDIINGEPVIPKKRAKDIIRKHMDGMEYPYMTKKDIEAATPASKEFLDECREVAKKYGKNDGWISVEERLPENNKSVLAYAKSRARGGDVCFVGSHHGGVWFLQSDIGTESYPTQYDIVAWRPLPEPYHPERSDNHDGE